MKGSAFLVLFLAIFCSQTCAQIPASRDEALRVLKGCSTRPITLNCSEDTAGYLVGLYEHGDRSLLRPLFDVGLHSDGALSELLGSFYADVLLARPKSFLNNLRSQPINQQRYLCKLAGSTDGSGMYDSTIRKIRRSMRSISTHNRSLATTTKVCIAEINRFNANDGIDLP